jgi:hypothetical protein
MSEEIVPVMFYLSEWLRIPHGNTVIMVTKVAWEFPTQPLQCTETHADFHVKCPLLDQF